MRSWASSIRSSRTPWSSPPPAAPPPTAREPAIASELRVELVVRDRLGSITTLITREGAVDARTAVAEIARGTATYVTGPDSWVRSRVKTLTGPGGDFLYANWDGTGRNNLHQLAWPETASPAVVCSPARLGIWTRVRMLVRRGVPRTGA